MCCIKISLDYMLNVYIYIYIDTTADVCTEVS